MENKISRGIVLYNRNYREDDKLVKIFTKEAGKRMFFVRHASRSKLHSVIQPLNSAEFILKLNDNGLSYIDDYKSTSTYQHINEDIFCLAYATYLAALTDSAIQDNTVDLVLYDLLEQTLNLIETGKDYEVLTNIFEVQLLNRFGVSINFHECAICHKVGGPFDFSHRYTGVLCQEHFHKDMNRNHLNPNVIFLMDRFTMVNLEHLGQVSVKEEMKLALRAFIDELYDDYVGIHLKSKSFIDDLHKWGSIMK